MKKKIINGILLVAMLFATTSAFVSCKDTDADYKSETDAKIAALQAQLDNLKGQVGPQGPQGPQGPAGQNGQDGQNGQNGQNGQDGQDGLTPFIGDNGNWWIGTTDTGIAAKGQDGKDGKDGKDGQDGKDGKDGQDGLTPFIGDNGNWWIGTKDTGVPAKGTGSQGPDFTKQIENLQNAIDDLKSKIWGSEDEFNNAVKSIQEQIKELAQRIADVYTTEVTSLSVDKVVNPMFEFSTPFGVNSNVLITFFGEKAKRHIFFPKGTEEPIVWKGDYLIEGTGNAGKLYVTVNPSSVDFTGKTLKLVNTAGDEAPFELTPLVASNEVLKYLNASTRSDNAFYETLATIPVEKLAKAYFSWEPTDMGQFKEQIIALLKGRGKEDIADMMQALSNLIAGNDIPAYRLQASWGNGYYTYSQANIAAVALKPLTYAFDIADAGNLEDTPISELEKLETYIVNKGTKTESTRKKIWRWLNKFNKETNKWLNNINWALQPTMFVDCNEEISRPGVHDYAVYNAGEITLIPTSWTVELLAPAFKKYVVVTSVNGEPVSPEDPVNAGLLGKVIPGSVNQIPLTIEAGKTYAIQYSALDYEGNTRTLNYYIKGKK